jgi:hypothetical protein
MDTKTNSISMFHNRIILMARGGAFKWIALIAIIETIFHSAWYYKGAGLLAWLNISFWALWLTFLVIFKIRAIKDYRTSERNKMYRSMYWGQIHNRKIPLRLKWLAVRSLWIMRNWK